MNRAIFLDRDGVINQVTVREGRPYPPANLEHFEVLPGVPEAIKSLRDAGFKIIVVTNQPDVATGAQRREVVEAMHQKLWMLGLCDDIKTCYHTDSHGCECRKPKPGMLIQAAQEWGVNLAESYMVGDRWRDVAAGNAVGCFTYFIDYKYQEKPADGPGAVVGSLVEASKLILREIDIRGE